MKAKRLLYLFVTTLALAAFFTVSSYAINGDVDGNGVVSVTDARRALIFSAGIETPTSDELDASDINRDGYVTIEDARMILRVAIEVIPPTDYTYTDWVTVQDSTCIIKGYATCTRIETDETLTKILPLKSHSYAPATCTKPQTCTVCGAKKGSALGHTTDYGVCTRCGEFITAEPLISVSGKEIRFEANGSSLKTAFGKPTEILTDTASENRIDIYVYASDYKNLNIFILEDNCIKSFFTNNAAASVKIEGKTIRIDNADNSKQVGDMTENVYRDTTKRYDYAMRISKSDFSYTLKNTTYYKPLEKLMFHLTNGCRALNDVTPLKYSAGAARAALFHSADMASSNYFSHDDENGNDCKQRLTNAGVNWSYCGENISAGYFDPFEITAGLFNSPSHRENILSKDFVYFGMGAAYNENSTYGYYCTQNFYAP